MAQTLIKYIGSKPMKRDNVAGTGLVWRGHGDVHPVAAAAAAVLLRHPDVWRETQAPTGGLADVKPAQRDAAGAHQAETGNPLLGLAVLELLQLAEIAPPEAVRQLREAGHIAVEKPQLAGMHLADLLEGAGIAPSDALQQLQAALGAARQPQSGEQLHGDADGAQQVDAIDDIDISKVDDSTDLSGLKDATLRAVVKAHGLKVDCRQRGDTLRTAVADALKAKARS